MVKSGSTDAMMHIPPDDMCTSDKKGHRNARVHGAAILLGEECGKPDTEKRVAAAGAVLEARVRRLVVALSTAASVSMRVFARDFPTTNAQAAR